MTKAREKQEENIAWELYISKYPNMDENSYISFQDFYNPTKIKSVVIEDKTEKEILDDVKEIIDSYNGGEDHRTI